MVKCIIMAVEFSFPIFLSSICDLVTSGRVFIPKLGSSAEGQQQRSLILVITQRSVSESREFSSTDA